MTELVPRKIVLVLVGNYLPGHKAGGILRTIANTVDHMCNEFDFKVLTRDRDLGDDKPYENVGLNAWQKVGNAEVYYVPPEAQTASNIAVVVNRTPHDAVYLNSFFDPLCVKYLFQVWRGVIPRTRVVLAPRGEFAWASLSQKYLKKYIFMALARAIGLYDGIVWHASSPHEAEDIVKVMKVDRAAIRIAFDFALKIAEPVNVPESPRPAGEELRLVFLSRIAREKNLDYAIRLLRDVKAPLTFDIYGPTADTEYWNRCQELIRSLPKNVAVTYRGVAGPADVLKIFSAYDLFLFPTGGEAFGQVIAEALMAGTPVLASTESAWRNLASDELGWDLPLTEPQAFIDAIEAYAALGPAEWTRRRSVVRAGVARRLADPAIPESHRRLFVETGAPPSHA